MFRVREMRLLNTNTSFSLQSLLPWPKQHFSWRERERDTILLMNCVSAASEQVIAFIETGSCLTVGPPHANSTLLLAEISNSDSMQSSTGCALGGQLGSIFRVWIRITCFICLHLLCNTRLLSPFTVWADWETWVEKRFLKSVVS